MKIVSYEPANNKNTEEYRSSLLIIIDRLNNEKRILFNNLYGSEGVSSGTWKLLAIACGISFTIVLIFNHSDTRETLFGITLIGFILGVYQTRARSKEEESLAYLLKKTEDEIKIVEEAYNYAIKHKDKEHIYSTSPGDFKSKKLYD
ncbi:hypothetical protein ACRCD8_08650 [Aliarcobacter sp. ERUVET-8]|uniref:hypothetical protein n=1 Tax=Aliarcobacter sp. ERUVET-8 TaxID=3429684 RepID=UPI003D6A1083